MYYIKLLLISQLVALSCTHVWTHSHDYIDDESLEDVHQPPATTTTLPRIEPENAATAQPDLGLEQLDDAVAVLNKGTSLPETTVQPTTLPTPPTPPTTTTTTTKKPTEEPLKPKAHQPLPHPHPHPYPHPYPYSQTGPHHGPYPYPYPQAGPVTKGIPESANEAGYPGYHGHPYASYPIPRRVYSSYGPPPAFAPHAYPPRFPGYAPGPVDSSEKPKPDIDDDATTDESMMKPTEESPKLPEQPHFGYPPVYVIQRRPQLPSYPYASPSRGYGSPYGYGR
ncbi:extensin [Drosophila grimshawi]|uniref:extensin n=1 Tax=Drosophila grimshawi TaxID=7222 RepID=UPI000C871027|nr:extensin [Drosophila grimshawi]